jgi:uncharacterized protein (TIGR03086 family)
MTQRPADRYRTNAALFTGTITALPDSAWLASTPCVDWTVRDVVAHVVDTQLDFLRQRGLAPDPEPVANDHPRDRWPKVRDAVQAVLDDLSVADTAFDGYFGPTTIAETLDRFYATDLSVHRWDVAQAANLPTKALINDDELAIIKSQLGSIDEAIMRSPGLFDPPVETAIDASPTDQLMAWLGRPTR